jgi:hypothetical protein
VWQPEDQPFGLFGWQGIIPAKAGKMASKSVDLMTEKLINVNEVFQRIDPARFAEVMEGGLFEMMTQVRPSGLTRCARQRKPHRTSRLAHHFHTRAHARTHARVRFLTHRARGSTRTDHHGRGHE